MLNKESLETAALHDGLLDVTPLTPNILCILGFGLKPCLYINSCNFTIPEQDVNVDRILE